MGQQARRTRCRAVGFALLAPWAAVAIAQNSAPPSALVQPKPTVEDVLASLVHHAGAIFAGEVYAIRLPQGANPPEIDPRSVIAGIPSSRPDTVEIEFRVDMGIRGTSIGSNYLLRMPIAGWQQGPAPFALHQRAVNFLKPPDAGGFSGPVQGEGDPPGQPLGVLPVDANNQVDLSRFSRLVTGRPSVGADAPPSGDTRSDGSAAEDTAPATVPHVPGVSAEAGRDTLISGSNQGQMPELNSSSVPFLALVRDVTVLSAAEAPDQAK